MTDAADVREVIEQTYNLPYAPSGERPSDWALVSWRSSGAVANYGYVRTVEEEMLRARAREADLDAEVAALRQRAERAEAALEAAASSLEFIRSDRLEDIWGIRQYATSRAIVARRAQGREP